MELKDIVCSLEYAKKLEELGIKQDSLFYHNLSHYPVEYDLLDNEGKKQVVKLDDGYGIPIWKIERNCASKVNLKTLQIVGMFGKGNIKDNLKNHINETNKRVSYSAFTSDELGRMLPIASDSYLTETKTHCEWNHEKITIDYLSEVDARAKMLIHLIKNNLK